MNEYKKLLQTNPILLRLSSIQLIAYFGAWFSNVAIYTLLLSFHVDAKVIAFTAMLHFLAGVIQAPISGSIIDKFAPKKLMMLLISVELISTFMLLFVQSSADLGLLYILIFVKMAAASFYFTTEMSLLPKILSDKNLQKANELHSMIWSFSYTLGMALSGVVVYLLGVQVAFIIDGMMFLGAFFLLFSLKLDLQSQTNSDNFFLMMKESLHYFKKTPQAFHLMLVHAFLGLTAFDALVVLMVDFYYSSFIAVSLAIGILNASRAIGLVVGPLFLGKWVNNKKIVLLFIAQAIAIGFWGLIMHNFYLSVFASVVVGFFTTTLWSYTYTLLQKNTDPLYYGRVVAYNDMLFLGSSAFTSYAIGSLYSIGFSLEVVTLLIAMMFIVASLYFFWILKTQNIKEIAYDA
jgi:MFS family permease